MVDRKSGLANAARATGDFLLWGARADGRVPRAPFYRHRLAVRVLHWINAIVLAVMLMSGLSIFNAHPALYWGADSDFAHPVLALTAERKGGEWRGITRVGGWSFDTTGVLGYSRELGRNVARGFPEWITLPGPRWLAMGRLWHFAFAWLFVANGILYAAYTFGSRHLTRDLVPSAADLRDVPREVVTHARLRFPKGDAARRYNALQKLAYLGVVFVLGPLAVLTGLTMSPAINAAFPELLWLFGGRQSARTIHFLCAFGFVLFFVVHIAMVVLSGTWNNLRAMITGWFFVEKAPHP
jgi:thiosulfate reductase cytochrome b subunit